MDHPINRGSLGRRLFDPCTPGGGCLHGLTCQDGRCVPNPPLYSPPQSSNYAATEISIAITLLPPPKSSGNVTTDVPSITIPTLAFQATSTIPIPTLIFETTSTISTPTIWTPASQSSAATSTAIATATATASPVIDDTHNRALVYISIPLALLSLLVLGIVVYKRWCRSHPKSSGLHASPAVQMRSQPRPAGLGTNTGMWTGKGHREYRGSASTAIGRGVV
jgi:hypothetical protein